MRFDIPKVIKPFEMSLYDMAMDGHVLQVWVNPPRGIQNEFYEIRARIQGTAKEFEEHLEKLREAPEGEKAVLAQQTDMINEKARSVNDQLFGWYADILSRHSDPETHVEAEMLRSWSDADPAFWRFVAEGVQALIRDHQTGVQKN